ncbi:Hsp33 family molecular chaperone HslO [Limnobacter humi]|uniref:Hsp33 family molecular chaperone HslO n=1 Tax=Limnobacter humi TaxID=1778671 RepID=A0ABT1WIG4_9BURK|nr:Hsp33 family molecular chaperone HslO [Limnobacter humi]MCQ8897209.1 Hsp33 family molecular chaperone HslO [Limnobacter humi]
MTDTLRTLVFETASVRAQLVSLNDSWTAIARNHDHPPAVLEMLGQLVAASAVLSASLKFEGSLILQIQGDGPVKLAVAECNSRLGLRATVKIAEGTTIAPEATFAELVNQQGKGICVIVLDPRNRLPGQSPYQGVVPLVGNSVADALEAYMHSSEQLETRLVLNADATKASGLMLQQMPTSGGKSVEAQFDPDGWPRLVALANTLQADEHLSTALDELATRLFWEENPAVLADRHPHFECSCSADKVRSMLVTLGEAEVREALSENPTLEVQCDFCGTNYSFNQADCLALFKNDEGSDEEKPTLH